MSLHAPLMTAAICSHLSGGPLIRETLAKEKSAFGNVLLSGYKPSAACVSRALRGGRGKEEPLSAIAMVLQAAPGDDGLPPPGPPRHTSAA